MIDPHKIAIVQGNSIATPDIFRVQILDLDVLHDNVGGSLNAQTTAFDDALAAGADDTLVAGHGDA